MPRTKYGYNFPDTDSDLKIELHMFRLGKEPQVDRAFHFKNVVRMLWGPKSKRHYVWDPWTDKMLLESCKHQYLWLSGCAASRKSSFLAVWGIINWLCSPLDTLVLVTSTSLEDARRRVWGEIEGYFMAGCESMNQMVKGLTLPGRIVSSTGKIRTQDGDKKYSDRCGMQLIAGDRAKEKENIGKLIGAHNKRVILLADELTELSPALVDAARSNLVVNPYFQMIGAGNFASIYDPFGVNAEPAGGWGSVTPDFDEWETKDGLCLRFDGLKSPNILLGEDRYPGQYGSTHLAKHKESFGENSALFWRMCRSFPCPEADMNRIYSEADLIKGDARGKIKWQRPPTKVASLDPAFATGGDRAMAYFGELGVSIDGVNTLQIMERKELREDIRKKDENRALQVCKLFVEECKTRGIEPDNAAFDESGGGIVFGSLLSEIWSNKPLGVQFGGAASDRPASVKDRRPARDAFANRVAEIWYAGIDFIQSGQIKGLDSQASLELCERRKVVATKTASGIKNRIESKDEMRKRTGGKSPDCFVAGTLIETSYGEIPIEKLKIGDEVLTPFGFSPIVKIHETQTNHLFRAVLSDGRILKGKGNHKIFTWDSGWVKLSELRIDNKLEMKLNYWKWKILNSLFTVVENTGFKSVSDTIAPHGIGMERRRNFFTGLSGITKWGLFQKACVSIIKITIGLITQSAIWSWLQGRNMLAIIENFCCLILNSKQRPSSLSWPVGLLGEKLLLQKSSCGGMGVDFINFTQSRTGSACIAESFFQHSKPQYARRIVAGPFKGKTRLKTRFAWFVEAASSLIGKTAQPVLTSVRESREVLPEKVYNLTLLEHNVYYANGILVQNCADAFLILLELCRVRFGFKASGMEGNQKRATMDWKRRALLANRIYQNVSYEEVAA